MAAVTQLTKLLTELVANTARIADELAQANKSRRTVNNDSNISMDPAAVFDRVERRQAAQQSPALGTRRF
ncbi:hypothetical protein FZI85_17300 [Mycobacterium sp. CBMA293]|uniref:hypothetical protein n=1 Tax=unclassified Mycolicibacterium TaxID=2636767 RepID=UPI0012DF67D8|nr:MULTISPECIES: hypothetical protein [unclassified Mycolicibacterium]MUL44479.1 hypothetical protein [Mycolicibacterium sp. CBMA 360]MUL59799.1 hypothetical protein [Mycolicibacterium sp. CBMA 335]MUL68642.1 hypothetical protein [Mycolicibacterium sp. CBMA 311]MUL93967.1 hypothetical protein [Mycolicibacterium sp. CBMA 230]MUM12773.1 hypothetical protein [Mycolicibacterium sp. CBMA 293]